MGCVTGPIQASLPPDELSAASTHRRNEANRRQIENLACPQNKYGTQKASLMSVTMCRGLATALGAVFRAKVGDRCYE